MGIFDNINALSELQVSERLGLRTARDGKSFVCPVCGHGEGGDGIRQSKWKGKLVWHCHGTCGTHWTSNADFIATVEGIDKDNKAGLARRLEELFPAEATKPSSFRGDNRKPAAGRSAKSDKRPRPPEPELPAPVETLSSPRNFAGFYRHCRTNYSLKDFVDGQGGAWRALTYATLEAAGCLYNPEYKVGVGVQAPVIIFPYDDELYSWRRVDEVPPGEMKCGVPKGTCRKPYIAAPLTPDFANFIVEGEVDALSIAQMWQVDGKSISGVIATGGATHWRSTAAELERRFGQSARKPEFIVLFDNDTAGFVNGRALTERLNASGFPAERDFFKDDRAGEHVIYKSGGRTERVMVPKVDANDLLRRDEDFFIHRLMDIYDCVTQRLYRRKAK